MTGTAMYFTWIMVTAILWTTGSCEGCDCKPCQEFTDSYQRCQCCTYHMVGGKRAAGFPYKAPDMPIAHRSYLEGSSLPAVAIRSPHDLEQERLSDADISRLHNLMFVSPEQAILENFILGQENTDDIDWQDFNSPGATDDALLATPSRSRPRPLGNIQTLKKIFGRIARH